jgi:hypothetical protein
MHFLAVLFAWPGERTGGRRSAEQYDLFDRDGEVPVDRLQLGHITGGVVQVDRLVADAYFTALRFDGAEDDLEQRRLAGTAGPDDAVERPGLYLKADVLQGRGGFIAGGYVA